MVSDMIKAEKSFEFKKLVRRHDNGGEISNRYPRFLGGKSGRKMLAPNTELLKLLDYAKDGDIVTIRIESRGDS